MGSETFDETAFIARFALRLRALRAERGWSLEELAQRSGVSRASLSRLENAEAGPGAAALGRLAAGFGLPLSQLIHMVERETTAVLRRAAQPVWRDPETGIERRAVSPPGKGLAGEVIECRLSPGARIAYDGPPRPGLEHHLVLMEGGLTVALEGEEHALRPGDCLRFRLYGPNAFAACPQAGALYHLFML